MKNNRHFYAVAALILAALLLVLSGCTALKNTVASLAEDAAPAEDEAEAPEEAAPADPFAGLKLYEGEGFSIYMEDGMSPEEAEGFIGFLSDDNCMLTVSKETFEDLKAAEICDADSTLEDYANVIAEVNQVTFEKNDYDGFGAVYRKTVDDNDFTYYTTVAKGSDAFWLITFASLEKDEAEYLPQFALWGSSFTVD